MALLPVEILVVRVLLVVFTPWKLRINSGTCRIKGRKRLHNTGKHKAERKDFMQST